MNRFFAVGALLALVLALSGCDRGNHSGQGPISLKLDPSPQIAVCEEIEVAEILAEFDSPDSLGRYEPVWDVSGGELRLGVGDTLSPASIREAFSDVEMHVTSFENSGRFAIAVTSAEGRSIVGAFDLEAAQPGLWLHPDGSSSAGPCDIEI